MEPHKPLPDGTEAFRPNIAEGPIAYFRKAWAFTVRYYESEMAQIASVDIRDVTADHFFREYVWVVHATGFSAKAVGKFMPRLLEAYGPWAELGRGRPDEAVERVRTVCNNPQKIEAVHAMARQLHDVVHLGTLSWEDFRERALSSPEKLAKLPYIGKITCYHLGRNIGLLECVKPDLHLVRMAKHWGFKDCVAMCEAMRDAVTPGTPLGLVDLALWYAASTFGTLEIKKEGSR